MPSSLEDLRAALAGRYEIDREIGQGGMATVYLTQDIRHERDVALKVLKPELAHALGPERFLREIKITAGLTHPHILPLLDSGEANGFLFYVMPYVEGESLRDRLDREKQLPIEEAVQIAREVADALSYAHSHDVLHRDIKPENILLESGHAVVADFGIARAISAAGGDRLTETGLAIGTPSYMSPEQALGSGDLDGRSDLYALGCVLYEMLAGQPPFTGPTVESIVQQHIAAEAPAITNIRPAVPAEIAAAVSRALAKTPADRFSPVALFAEALTVGHAVPPPVSTAPTPVSRTARQQSRRNLIAYATVATLAIIGVYAGISRSPASAELPRIAVLPFDNLGSAEDEYFADGITEEITSRIADISGLRVISRQSAIQYKNSDKTLRQISEELSVGYVLEGTIRTDRSPDGSGQVRVTPQLIRASDDAHLWTNRYTASLVPGEIFRVQEQIAEQVARALDVTLLEPERRRLAATPTDNQEAYEYYMRGNDYVGRSIYKEQDRQIAIQMYQKAVELDPNFALAYAGLSQGHSQMWWFFHDRTQERLAMSKEAVDRALRLSPDLPEAHEALGWYHYHGHLDYEPALVEFAIAEESQPNNGNILYGIAAVQRRQGRMQEALTNFIRAAELAPRSATAAAEVAVTYTLLRDPVEAGRFYERAISLSPDLPDIYHLKVGLHLRVEANTDRARTVLERAEGVGIGSSEFTFAWIVLHTLEGNYQEALDRLALVSSEVLHEGQIGFVPTAQLYAQIHGLMGNQQLERAYYDSARSVLETEIQQHPDDSRYRSALGIAYAGLGRKDDAIREGELAVELLPMSREAWQGAYRAEDLARIYAMVGEYDAAVDQLEHLLSVPSPTAVPWLRIDPSWNPLRGHPRFQRLLQQEN